MEQIVAVTFTEKAAGELKLRLREALETARTKADADVRGRLDEALEKLEEAHVNTIHGFCAELIRERPVEACVDPLFGVLTGPQADQMYTRAFQAWLQEALANPPEGVRRALRRTSAPAFPGAGDGEGPVDRLRRAGRALADGVISEPWRKPAFGCDGNSRRLERLHRLAALSGDPVSPRGNPTGHRRGAPSQPADQARESFGQVDHDGWEVARRSGGPISRTRKGSSYDDRHAARTRCSPRATP
jgi:hypothetical protein